MILKWRGEMGSVLDLTEWEWSGAEIALNARSCANMPHATSFKLAGNFSFHWNTDCTGHRKEYGCATTELRPDSGREGGCYCDSLRSLFIPTMILTVIIIMIIIFPISGDSISWQGLEIWAPGESVRSVIIFQICDGAQCQTLPVISHCPAC